MGELTNAKLTDVGLGSISTDGEYTVTGGGVYDDLMEAVNAHLSAQLKLNRLSGDDYANVYLGLAKAAMSNAVQYLSSGINWELTAKQILSEEQKTELLKAQVANESKKGDLIDSQVLESEANTAVAEAQVEKIAAETGLLEAKLDTEFEQQEVLKKQQCLYSEQAKGFYWNAMKNWAKLTADVESVYVSAEKDTISNAITSSEEIAAAKPCAAGGTNQNVPCTGTSPCV